MIDWVGSTAYIGCDEDLETLPDGTLISWIRVGGDKTSRCVAFVHVERERANDGAVTSVVWISPGGWSPMSPDDAGIQYPAQVVIWGDLDEFLDKGMDRGVVDGLTTMHSEVLLSGGTWPRQQALEAASRVYQGLDGARFSAESTELVLTTAAQFADWLAGTPPTPEPPVITPQEVVHPCPADAEAQRDLDTAEELRRVRTVLGTHREVLQPSATLMRRISELAYTYQARGKGHDK